MLMALWLNPVKKNTAWHKHSELKFEDVNFMCKKASQKLYGSKIEEKHYESICWISIWMLPSNMDVPHSRGLNYKINRINERVPRITYKEKSSTFQELLKKDNSVSINHRNVQKNSTEIYKDSHGFSPPISNGIFAPVPRPYNFHRNDPLQGRRVNSVRHGTEFISFLGTKIWNIVPSDIKLSQSLSVFKRKIKIWVSL